MLKSMIALLFALHAAGYPALASEGVTAPEDESAPGPRCGYAKYSVNTDGSTTIEMPKFRYAGSEYPMTGYGTGACKACGFGWYVSAELNGRGPYFAFVFVGAKAAFVRADGSFEKITDEHPHWKRLTCGGTWSF